MQSIRFDGNELYFTGNVSLPCMIKYGTEISFLKGKKDHGGMKHKGARVNDRLYTWPFFCFVLFVFVFVFLHIQRPHAKKVPKIAQFTYRHLAFFP